MNKIFRLVVVLFILLASAGCSGKANAVKSYVEDKLEASGCDYKMGKVEVTDVQRTPEDFANGTSSAQDIKVHFSVKRTTGEFQDTFIIFLLAKDQEFDKSDPRLYAFDVALKTRTHNCIKKGN